MAGKAGTVYIKADRNVEVAKTSVMIGDDTIDWKSVV